MGRDITTAAEAIERLVPNSLNFQRKKYQGIYTPSN
jgi:hypothetical protein